MREKTKSIHLVRAKYTFIDFEVGRRTRAFVELARAGNYFMTLVGPAGLGKTEECKQIQRSTIQRDHNQIVYIELGQDDCSELAVWRAGPTVP